MRKQFILTILFLQVQYVLSQQPAIRLPGTDHKTVVIAHRGNHINVPENTLAAYEQAITCGADFVEVDLRMTRDSHLIAMHDATIERMTGSPGRIKSMTYQEISEIRILPVKKTDTTIYHIPDFASILDLCHERIHIYLDFKDGDIGLAFRMIKVAHMENQVVVYLNKEGQYHKWKEFAPKMPLMASLPKNLNQHQLTRLLQNKPIQVVDNTHSKEWTKLLHNNNLQVWLDVQNDLEGPDIWSRALDLGADGLQTDHPESLIRYLKNHGIR